MSFRAKVAGVMIRHLMKKRMATFGSPDEVRQLAGGMPGKVHKEAVVEPVDAGGVQAEWISFAGHNPAEVILYLHGGGYVFGGLDSHRDIGWRLAQATGKKVLLIDYRLAPEHVFPAAVEDAFAAYTWLLEQGLAADNLVVAGDSAGGGLSLALALKLKAESVVLPGALVLLSPWCDLTLQSPTIDANDASDVMLSRGALQRFANLYLDEHDPTAIYASPLLGDLSGLPRTYVIVGSGEVLRGDTDALVAALSAADVPVSVKVWEDMMHVFPIAAQLIPEGRVAIEDIAEFLRG